MQYPRNVWIHTSDEILLLFLEPVLWFLIPIAIVINSWNIFFLTLGMAICSLFLRFVLFIPGHIFVKRIPVFISNLIFGRYVL